MAQPRKEPTTRAERKAHRMVPLVLAVQSAAEAWAEAMYAAGLEDEPQRHRRVTHRAAAQSGRAEIPRRGSAAVRGRDAARCRSSARADDAAGAPLPSPRRPSASRSRLSHRAPYGSSATGAGKVRILNEAHASDAQRATPLRVLLVRARHEGCGGQPGKAELLTSSEGARRRTARRIVLREGDPARPNMHRIDLDNAHVAMANAPVASQLMLMDTTAAAPPTPQASIRNRCQWPMWPHDARVPRPPIYCGAPSVPGQSFCAAHCRIAFEPRSPTRGAGEQRLTNVA
jgi:hypothetical protein